MNSTNRRSSRPRRLRVASAPREMKIKLAVEECERRQMLTGGFLQGTAFIDANGNGALDKNDSYLSGVEIDLYNVGGLTPVATTHTDANGAYSFTGLPAGQYVVKEVTPDGYTSSGAQALSELNPVTATTTKSITVTVVDPNSVFLQTGFDPTSFEAIQDTVYPNTPGLTRTNQTSVGKMTTSLGTTLGGTDIDPGFISFCADDLHTLATFDSSGNKFQVLPEPGTSIPTGNGANTVSAAAAGRIAYLFNHDASPSLSAIDAAGLQVAIWALIYDAGAISLPAGDNYEVDGPISPFTSAADFTSIIAAGNAFLAESLGKSEAVTYLDPTLGGTVSPAGIQGLLSTDSLNFGNTPCGTIRGAKFNDVTGNGITSDDTRLGGVTINLFLNGGSVPVQSTTTGPDGSYSFTGLAPGSYSVQEAVPPGWTETVGTAGYTVVVPLGTSVVSTNDDFADFHNITVSGTKFNDITGNGFSADDTPLAGVTIQLFKNGGATPVASAVTGTNGSYNFTNLGPGSYVVKELVPAGSTLTGGPAAGYTISATSGMNSTGDNFDDYSIITISGTKFDDLTGNGFSADDTPLGGVTIDLFKSGVSGVFAHTTTAADGTYSFTNLAPGTYSVQEVVPSGWVQTGGGPGSNGSYMVVACSGQTFSNKNFDDTEADCDCNYSIVCETVIGPCGPTQINGLSGNTDEGDVLTVTVSVPAGGCADLSLVSYTAPAASFDANTASQQVVFDSDSIDVTNTTRKAQTYTLTVQIPNSDYQVDLVCGKVIDKFGPAGSNIFYHAQDRFINGGYEKQLANPASLSGEVYVDTNDNGQVDDHEVGLAGVMIHLTGTDVYGNSVSLYRVTGADGTYSFQGLQPSKSGGYTVTESQPSGFVTTANSIGTVNGSPDGHLATPTTNAIDKVLLALGNDGVDYDFGELASGTAVCRGATQSCSFWHGNAGQGLIKCFDDGSSCTSLGDWLAASFPNLYGNSGCNLAGKTNSQVAAYYQSLYNSNSSSVEVQVLATALDVYASCNSLGGCSAAVSCGFAVTDGGLGCETYNVGSSGGLFGMSNYSSACVIQLLQCVNSQATNGVCYAGNNSYRSKAAGFFSGLRNY